jgi:adenosine deaminase CECR1
MMFTLSKSLMESTLLWRIIRRMPKGCLLHAHMDAMVDFDYLFDVLLSTPGMHILADRPLADKASLEEAVLKFRFLKNESKEDGSSIWKEGYKANTPVLLTTAVDAFPHAKDGEKGGRKGFLEWLYSRCTISRTEAVEQHHGVDHIWRKFCEYLQIPFALPNFHLVSLPNRSQTLVSESSTA